MLQYVQVKLGEGRSVIDPDNGRVLEVGRSYRLKQTQFWLKRLQSGDVVLDVPAEEPKVKKEKAGK